MPLIIPTVVGRDAKSDWENILIGKTIHEADTTETAFNKNDLPEKTRVIGPNTPTTRDLRPNRLNVHTTEDGVVTHITYG